MGESLISFFCTMYVLAILALLKLGTVFQANDMAHRTESIFKSVGK